MQNLKEKYGKKALITGGSSGIGKAFAIELAKQGIEPILVARNKEKLKEIEQEILSKYKVRVQTFSVDLSNEKETLDFIQEISSSDIGLFIHSAGMEHNGSFTKISSENGMKLIKLNISSTFLLTNHFAKQMTEKKKGGILLVSSMAGLMPSPYFSNYAASKSYVHTLGLSLYFELKNKGVDIAVLAPGLTDTNMVADNGVDWSKVPMAIMAPSKAAQISLANLGKKATIIPGFMNKMMVMMARRVFSMKSFSGINGSMTRKAISNDKL
ncbi:MAG: SDR family NAD(P)-dependent oxidoreductase [Prolixibacteraceae bacterium]